MAPELGAPLKSGRPDVRLANLVIELKHPSEDIGVRRDQLFEYMKDLFEEYGRMVEVYGLLTNGASAELYEYAGAEPILLGSGVMPNVARHALSRLCSQRISVKRAEDLAKLLGLSHSMLRVLYEVLGYYSKNEAVGRAATVLNYFKTWKVPHALTVNISKEEWKAVGSLAQDAGIAVRSGNQRRSPFFSIETYLYLLVRLLALSKLGVPLSNISNIRGLRQEVENRRKFFPPSPFEWFFEAVDDSALPDELRQSLRSELDLLLKVASKVDATALTVDVFRELY